jgi:uncharacterized membrane protein YjjB (DUF3815 family)
MYGTPWFLMFFIAAIPVVGLLLFFNVVRRGREKLPWENGATYVAYGVLAILLISLVLGKFVFD